MSTHRRSFAAVVLLAAVALAGCATNAAPGAAPSSSGTDAAPSEPAAELTAGFLPKYATWSPDGSLFVLTGDDGGCGSAVDSVEVSGATVTVRMRNNAAPDTMCAAIAALDVSYAVQPGLELDPTVAAQVVVTNIDHEVPALNLAPIETGAVGGEGTVQAFWTAPHRIGLVTYGSSSCRPEATTFVQTAEAAATVTIAVPDGGAAHGCTDDLAPRFAAVIVPDDSTLTEGATLTITDADAGSSTSAVVVGQRPA